VAIFFVISGYVLSLKPLTLLREGELVKLGDSLSSSLFRRWPRLYLPLIVTTFIFMIFNYMIPGLTISKAESTFSEEAFKWYAEIKEFTFIFRAGGLPWFSYNDHSWAIPLEFKGSIIIYISLLIFSRCTKFARLWCELGMIFYFLYIVDGWYCSLFVSGMLLCDLDLLAEDNDLPSFLVRFEPYKDLIFTSLFIIGMYLGGVPSFSNDIQVLRESPGWHYLSFLKPQAVFMYKSFYLFWASVFIVAAIPRIPWLKSFFESPFNQYLGRISYSLYLVHGPILRTIGDRVYAAVGWAREAHVLNITRWTGVFRLPKSGPLGLEFSYIVAHMFLLPLTLWVARVVTSLIDEPSIKISRWAYDKVKPSADSPKLVT
jgi:peptidoglycan/LPS O-acetylase OafA/YrhL